MAKIIGPELTERPTPRPSSAVVNIRTGQQAAGMQQFAEGAGQLSNDLFYIQQQEKEKLDNVKVDDAVNQTKKRILDLSNAEDGFASVKGGAVTDKEFSRLYKEKLSSFVDQQLDGFGNEEQKAKYKRIADSLKIGYEVDLINHSVKQADIYNGEVYTGSLAVRAQEAKVGWADSKKRDSAIKQGLAVIEEHAKKNNKPAEWVAEQKLGFMKGVHASIVNQAIVDQNYIFADDYLKTHKKDMDSDQFASLKKVVDGRNNDIKILDTVDGFNRRNKEATAKEARDYFYNKKFANNPDMAKSAYAEWSAVRNAEVSDKTAKIKAANDAIDAAFGDGSIKESMIRESGSDKKYLWLKRLRTYKTNPVTSDSATYAQVSHDVNTMSEDMTVDDIWKYVDKKLLSVPHAQALSNKLRELQKAPQIPEVKQAFTLLGNYRTDNLFASNDKENNNIHYELTVELQDWVNKHQGEDPSVWLKNRLKPIETMRVREFFRKMFGPTVPKDFKQPEQLDTFTMHKSGDTRVTQEPESSDKTKVTNFDPNKRTLNLSDGRTIAIDDNGQVEIDGVLINAKITEIDEEDEDE